MEEDYIEIPKSKLVTTERIFSHLTRDIITTDNGAKIDVIEKDEVFAYKIGDIYHTYHFLPSGEVQETTIKYRVKDYHEEESKR